MMKRLIPIALIVCMLFALVSCDFLFPEKNDPEKNMAHIVEALNSESAIDEIFAPQNAADSTVTPEEMLSPESLVEIIKGIAIEGTVNTNLGGEAHSGYLGIKDGVIYVKEGENEQYIFIEDDLKIVTVDKIYGDYYGAVNVELTQTLETLKDYLMSTPSDDKDSNVEGKVEAEDNILANIELPEITAEDVTYDEKNDRYVLSEEYVNEVIETVLDEILRESLPGTSIVDRNAQKAAMMEYVKELNVEFYFRAKFEKMLGFGASLAASDDLKQEAELEELAFDFYFGIDAINAHLIMKNSETALALDADVVMNENGEPDRISFNMSMASEYWEPSYLGTTDLYSVCGKESVTISLMADLGKLGGDGELLSFRYNQTVDGIKIFAENYWPGDDEYEFINREMTKKYADKKITSSATLTVTASNKGQDYLASLIVDKNDEIEGEKSNDSATLNVSTDVKSFPEIPEKVEKEKQSALDEYNYFFGDEPNKGYN